jgi:hypothetical protein
MRYQHVPNQGQSKFESVRGVLVWLMPSGLFFIEPFK